MTNKPTIALFAFGILVGLILPGAEVIFAQTHDAKPMALSGYSVSQAYDVEDDKPLNFEDEFINRLLYRIKKTSPKSRGEFARYSQDVNWNQISEKTEDFRFWLFKRRVQVKGITKHRFAKAEKDTEIKGVFACHCENEKGEPVIVLARSIPRKLQLFPKGDNEIEISEPIGFEGFLLNRVNLAKNENDATATCPVFVADRIEWYPNTTAHCDQAHVVLAKAGADIGQLDYVREHNTRRLGKGDSEAFYQILGAAKKTPDDDGIEDRLGFMEIMQNPNSNFCHAAGISGVIRRCTEIPVNSPQISSRLGISKYYELIVFPDLDGGKIIVKNKSGNNLEYRRFPITVCCTELPDGMSPTAIEKSRVAIEGYFYRFWKYQSDKTDLAGTTGQVSPLLMAKRPALMQPQSSNLNFILLIFASLVIAGIAILLWSYRIADRKRKSPGQKILESLPGEIDLSGIQE